MSESAVAAAAERLRLAMIDPAHAVLDALLAEGLSYGHSNGAVDTKAEFIAGLVDGVSDFTSIDISDQSVRVMGDAALVRHTLRAIINDGGQPGSVHILILQVGQRQDGQWKLIARQAVRPPA